MYKIMVPATSANLSVGFDVLGLALDIYNEFYVEENNDFLFTGFDEGFLDKKNNLFYKAYEITAKSLNIDIKPFKVKMVKNVPTSRGLGSSSTLIVGGILACLLLNDLKIDKNQVLKLAAMIEGHPDNVAPAIYGGLVSTISDDEYIVCKYEVSNNLKFLVLIPDYEVKTEEARSILPKNMNYKDVVNNLSRIVMLPEAFKKGDAKFISKIFVDKMHEPYRAKLIKEYDVFKRIALENDSALCISGSGSTMLVISNKDISDKFDIEKKKVNISDGFIIIKL